MLFLIQKLVGDWELSGQLISIMMGTLTVVPIFLLGRSLYDEKVGWFSALFYIILPNIIRFDIEVLRDPTYWFFMASTLCLAWHGIEKNRMPLFGLASITGGMAALTRLEGSVLLVVIAAYSAFGKGLGMSTKKRLLSVGILLLLFPILLSPVLFSMKKFSNPKALSEMVSYPLNVIKVKTRAILKPGDPIDGMGWKSYNSLPQLSQDVLELASRHRFVLAISEVIYKFAKSANLLIVLILLGFWKRKREGLEAPDWYLLVVFTGLFIMSVFYARQIYYFSTRHGLTLVLPCIFFAGHGLEFIAERFSRGLNRLTSGWSFVRKYLLHFLMIFFTLIFLAQGISFKRTDKFIQKEIGLWLKDKGYEGSVIMGPKKLLRLAFYANGKFLEMPDSWEKVIQSIRENGVKIVIVDSCTIEQYYPDFLVHCPEAGIFPLTPPKREGKKCVIQVYEVK
jgi:4-amino-4-deoxy-L-arabinose transferase-like glycosyltransferase